MEQIEQRSHLSSELVLLTDNYFSNSEKQFFKAFLCERCHFLFLDVSGTVHF